MPDVQRLLVTLFASWLLVPTSNAFELVLSSSRGLYTASLFAPVDAPPIGSSVNWELRLATANGIPFVPDQISVFGGMPAHGHGLPTAPAVTQALGPGRFLLEGLEFNMSGRWRVGVRIVGPRGIDTLGTEFNLQPPPIPSTNGSSGWSPAERALIASLSLDALPDPVDPSNRWLNHPTAIELGQMLFNDSGLSAADTHSCASCHDATQQFTDGRPLSLGSKPLKRHAPSLIGSAHFRWFYWDGRRDSLWAQALTPIETMGEMDNNRSRVVRKVLADPDYRVLIGRLRDDLPDAATVNELPVNAGPFASAPDRARWQRLPLQQRELINRWFAFIGKTIAAYETTLVFTNSRFDQFAHTLKQTAEAKGALSEQEQDGLRLFLDVQKTHCLRCHNGPRFSNGGFHNIGTGANAAGEYDFGRVLGIQAIWYDPFRCDGTYSDATPEQCDHLRFVRKRDLPSSLQGAFKVPTLRGVAHTAPYFHDGRFADLDAVMDFYIDPGPAEESGHELPELKLTEQEKQALIAFMRAL